MAATSARAAVSLAIDGALTPAAVTDEFLALLERAGPYGQGNPQPRFAFPAHRVKFAKVVGGAHVRCVLEAGDGSRLDAVAFRAADQPLGAGAARLQRACRCTSPATCAATPGAAATAASSSSRTSPTRAARANGPLSPNRAFFVLEQCRARHVTGEVPLEAFCMTLNSANGAPLSSTFT